MDALSASRRSAFVAATTFVPRDVRGGRGARHRVCARGETKSLSGALERRSSEGPGPFGGRRGKEADLFVRIPGNRESVFRGAVRKDSVPVSDILQVWLDVGQHPARGKEQADLIWRRILSSAFESSEP
jgi:hypothetical protein